MSAPFSADFGTRVLNNNVIFLTGATGFVGKVLLEKIVRGGYSGFSDTSTFKPGHRSTLPRKIFLLVRSSNGLKADERVEKEIVLSPIFESFIKLIGQEGFRKLCQDILVPVSGDVTLPNLGISDVDYVKLTTANVDIILHCAASVNFDDPLEHAIQLNTEGALRTLELGKALNVRGFVHVSTAYVTANIRTGQVAEEKIYPMEFDPEIVMKKARKQSIGKSLGVSKLQLKIQGDFPNTYTLTKAMSEVLIDRYHGDIPVAIVRPSIVGAAWKEPCPGWVDVVSAASAVFMGVCLGVVTMLPGDPRGVAAIIPVDFVVNHILIACAEIFDRPGALEISHCCSSTYNPCRWRVVSRSVVGAYRKRTPPVKLVPGAVKFRMLPNKQQFALEWYFRYLLPTWAFGQFARLSGSKSYIRTAGRLDMLLDRSDYLVNLFEPFTSNEYLFDSTCMKKWEKSQRTDILLYINVLDVAWPRYFENYVYGLNRFILHEDLVPISESSVTHNDVSLTVGRLLHWDADHHRISFPGIISDISWAYTSSREPGYTKSGGILGRLMGLTGWREGLAHEAKHVPRRLKRTVVEMKELVFRSKPVRRAIRHEVKGTKQSRKQVQERALMLLDEIASTMIDQPPRAFGWALRKVWRLLYEGIRVHEEGLETLRAVVSKGKHPVVLVPTHRSYVDFLMLSYLFFAFNLPVPFIASSTDFLRMKGVSDILRKSGAFFLRRQGTFQKDKLYGVIFTEYMQRLLMDGQTVEYYVEGTRSRSGKTLEPKDGITRICVDAVRQGRVKDVTMVPISIDYEKPIEAMVYSQEMLGISKAPETTGNLLKSAMILGEKFGHVSVQFGDHISIKSCLEQHDNDLLVTSKALGLKIIKGMNTAGVCMPIHLVSTLLLMYRHGITLDQLISSVEWLRKEVLERGGHVACAEGEHRTHLVKRAIGLLGQVVQERRSPRVFEVAVNSSPKDYVNMVILGYYRNKIIHLFATEALWACALYAHWAAGSSSKGVVVAPTASFEDDNNEGELTGEGILETMLEHGGRFVGEKNVAGEHQEEEDKKSRQAVGSDIVARLDSIRQDVDFLQSMLKREFVVGESVDEALASLLRRKILQTGNNDELLRVHPSITAERVFGLLCSMAWPFVDSYFIAASALVAYLPDAQVRLPTLIQRMSILAESLYHDRVILHYESCSSGTLRNAVDTFLSWNVIALHEKDAPKLPGQPKRSEVWVNVKPPYNDRIVLQKLIDRIKALRGPLLSISSATVAANVAGFPMLARI